MSPDCLEFINFDNLMEFNNESETGFAESIDDFSDGPTPAKQRKEVCEDIFDEILSFPSAGENTDLQPLIDHNSQEIIEGLDNEATEGPTPAKQRKVCEDEHLVDEILSYPEFNKALDILIAENELSDDFPTSQEIVQSFTDADQLISYGRCMDTPTKEKVDDRLFDLMSPDSPDIQYGAGTDKPYNIEQVGMRTFMNSAREITYRVNLEPEFWRDKRLLDIHDDLDLMFEDVLADAKNNESSGCRTSHY